MIPIENDNKRIDWNTIRAEYIGGGISQRKLAEKHGIPVDTLLKVANKGHWKDYRDEASNKAAIKAQQKVADVAADNATLAADIKHMLLLKVQRIGEKYPADATEVRTREDGKTIVYRLKDLTAAYKDLTADMVTTENADIEDLIPLMELLQ